MNEKVIFNWYTIKIPSELEVAPHYQLHTVGTMLILLSLLTLLLRLFTLFTLFAGRKEISLIFQHPTVTEDNNKKQSKVIFYVFLFSNHIEIYLLHWLVEDSTNAWAYGQKVECMDGWILLRLLWLLVENVLLSQSKNGGKRGRLRAKIGWISLPEKISFSW